MGKKVFTRKRQRAGSETSRSSTSQVDPADVLLVAEPEGRANSFVGTEEYLAPEVINGTGHTAAVDWWSFGILMYELVYGFTPFRGSKREATFESILKRPLAFPSKPVVSPACQVSGAFPFSLALFPLFRYLLPTGCRVPCLDLNPCVKHRRSKDLGRWDAWICGWIC